MDALSPGARQQANRRYTPPASSGRAARPPPRRQGVLLLGGRRADRPAGERLGGGPVERGLGGRRQIYRLEFSPTRYKVPRGPLFLLPRLAPFTNFLHAVCMVNPEQVDFLVIRMTDR